MKYILLLSVILTTPVLAQHADHPQDIPLHNEFYVKWKQPLNGNPRLTSCCSDKDCYPTPIRFDVAMGKWVALHRETGSWVAVPDEKLEQLQQDTVESPDGQSHACITSSGYVYCATLGSGV